MRNTSIIASIIIIFLSVFNYARAEEVAIIGNKEITIDNISSKELVDIFKQEKQYLGNKKIYLIMLESGSREKKIMLKKIYSMTEEELKKLWLFKMFGGEITGFPKVFASNEAVKSFVSRVSNAIGFINADFLDDSVKVFRVDNKLPSDTGYLLIDLAQE